MNLAELAKQAGFQQTSAVRIESPYIGGADLSFELERFAHLVRAAALEEAAEYLESVHRTRLVKFANAIRALKGTA